MVNYYSFITPAQACIRGDIRFIISPQSLYHIKQEVSNAYT